MRNRVFRGQVEALHVDIVYAIELGFGYEGELQRGDCFWIVGEDQIKDFADFKRHLLADRQSLTTAPGCRVVYSFSRPDSESGLNPPGVLRYSNSFWFAPLISS